MKHGLGAPHGQGVQPFVYLLQAIAEQLACLCRASSFLQQPSEAHGRIQLEQARLLTSSYCQARLIGGHGGCKIWGGLGSEDLAAHALDLGVPCAGAQSFRRERLFDCPAGLVELTGAHVQFGEQHKKSWQRKCCSGSLQCRNAIQHAGNTICQRSANAGRPRQMTGTHCLVVLVAVAPGNLENLTRALLLHTDVATELVHAHSKGQSIDVAMEMRGIASAHCRDRDVALDCVPSPVHLSKKALGVGQVGKAKYPRILSVGEEVGLIGLRTDQSGSGFEVVSRLLEFSDVES